MRKGYRAYVQVYDEKIYVDTFTGEGYDLVLKKIEPLICKRASRTRLSGLLFEDVKSELTIIALEGIQNFDPHRNIKLSTFLHSHLHNKTVSKIKSDNRRPKDAFFLEGKNLTNDGNFNKARSELHFSSLKPLYKDGESSVNFEDTVSKDNNFYSSGKDPLKSVEFEASLRKASSNLESKTKKIVELMYYKDYSIKDAAKEVNLSGWTASLRLKKLSKRSSFKSTFGMDKEFNNLKSSKHTLGTEDTSGNDG